MVVTLCDWCLFRTSHGEGKPGPPSPIAIGAPPPPPPLLLLPAFKIEGMGGGELLAPGRRGMGGGREGGGGRPWPRSWGPP